MTKLCECGCGLAAPIASRTDSKYGAIKGRPRRFIHGHRIRGWRTSHRHTVGRKKSPTYKSWQKMNQRCCNPRSRMYPRYGGRGISVDPSWRSFETFLRDMGERPNDKTLDRIDNNGDYSPSNCRWATKREQCNNMAKSAYFTHLGLTLTVTQWAEKLSLDPDTLYYRYRAGWQPPDLFRRPARGQRPGVPSTSP